MFTQLIPKRLRIAVTGLTMTGLSLHRTIVGPQRALFVRRHSPEDLAHLTEIARAERQERLLATGQAELVRERVVSAVVHHNDDAVTIEFENDGEEPIRFAAGQYLILHLQIAGETVRRAYSICSSAHHLDRIAVTVKRVAGGMASNWLNDNVAEGDRIALTGAHGRFTAELVSDGVERYVLIAAGVGITPLHCILQWLSAEGPEKRVELVYGNRSESDILFFEALAALEKDATNLSVVHTLSQPPDNWSGRNGRLEGELLEELVVADREAVYFICGPEGMMAGVSAHLSSNGVPADNIKTELFVSPHAARSESTGEIYTVQFAQSGILLQVPDDTTLLEAGLAAGLPLGFSCSMGGCSACKVKVLSGEVDMDEPNCLTPREISEGYRLACCSRPRSTVEIDA